MDKLDEILSTQTVHTEMLKQINRGVAEIELKGLKHLETIANGVAKFADSDELKVKLIASQKDLINPLFKSFTFLLVIILVFVSTIFFVIEKYDVRAKTAITEIEIKK